MRKYRLVAKKGEGTFSEVLKAQNVKDGKYHAIKCMKNRFESIDQVNNLREIQALRRLSPHEHIITLEEVLYDQPTGRLALVFELMDANLYELIRGRRHYLNPNLIKSNMWQLMKSLDHMHKKGIFHRDIKPENILIESTSEFGRGLKLADFGSCRGIYSKQPYTEYISTRWYRAPECLLTDGYYGPEMDLWGAGCVFFEITSLYPLFPGTNEVDQISRIHKVLGTPSPECLAKFKSKGASHISFDFPPQKGIGIPQLVPHASPEAIDLMVKLLKYDASERITAREAMRHPYFKDIRDNELKQPVNDEKASSSHGVVELSKTQQYVMDQTSKTGNYTKPLPSIVGANSTMDSKINATSSTHDLHISQQQQVKQSSTLKSIAGSSINSNNNNSNNATSSLPPINVTGTNNQLLSSQLQRYPDQKSSHNNNNNGQQQQQLNNSNSSTLKKKNKKYKTASTSNNNNNNNSNGMSSNNNTNSSSNTNNSNSNAQSRNNHNGQKKN